MKPFVVLLVICVLVDSKPQFLERNSDDVDNIFSQRPAFKIDILRPNSDNSHNSFENFMKRMQETITSIRERMDSVMKHISENPQNETTLFRFGDGPLENKTTSESKIIDGHVVTVNQTTYSTGSDGNVATYHFKTVEIQPKNEETDEGPNVKETTVEPRSSSGAEETNDIPTEKVGSEVDDLNKA
uniref:Uncharacterized protein n=1 Tax=Clastoptera arizonana TaxID=38151 RepID=A0A1B6DJ72_9HEMI